MPRQSTKSPKPVQSYRTVEFKLYLNKTQEDTLNEWLRSCCYLFNHGLAQRKKAYSRRKESVTLYDQFKLLTGWRKRDSRLSPVPIVFLRDALRRVDRGMQAFFARAKVKTKTPGFPRFKSQKHYKSLETLGSTEYVVGKSFRIPKLGCVRARGPFRLIPAGEQKLLRVIRRPSGWYAQVLVPVTAQPLSPTGQDVAIDVGLESLLTTDTGEKVGNPRLIRNSAKKLRAAQKTLSRRQKGSNRRKKAVRRVGLLYERLQRRRCGLAHLVSRDLVNRFDRIAFEDLNLRGLCRGFLRKSVLDAAWGQLLRFITYKAENAGRVVVAVDPRGTSQECPACWEVTPKKLSDRVHNCSCGLVCDRDHAAALVIRHRAFRL